MNTGESQILWVGLAILVLLLFLGIPGIRLALGINRKLTELLRIAIEIEGILGQIRLQSPSPASISKASVRSAQIVTKPKPATASCNCQHCGREFLFYVDGLTEEKSFGKCPGCGKLTKLQLPSERKFETSKTNLSAVCSTCATRIPFSKSEEWSKTTCPVCGSETILQSEGSEMRGSR